MNSPVSHVRIPRTVTLSLLIAIARHSWAAVNAIGSPGNVRAPDWVALILAEVLLLCVALHIPKVFYLRTLRLAGVVVAANALVVLAPLPDVVATYQMMIPRLMLPALAAGIATMALTFLAMSKWSAKPNMVRSSRPIRNERILPAVIVIATIVIIPIWFATSGIPPLFTLLGGSSGNDLALDRQNALSRLGSVPLRLALGILRNLLIMFAAGWFIADAVKTPRSVWRQRSIAELTAMAVLGLGVFFALVTTERAIVGELLAVCGISALVVNRKELTTRLIGVLVAAAAIFPIAVGILSGAGSPFEVLIGLKRRIFYLPTEVMTRYFIEFPQFHQFLDGASVPKLSYLTGGNSFDLSGYMYQRYYQRSPGIMGNANGSFFGVAWANFGFIGVVGWSLALAVAFVVLDKMIDAAPLRSGAALRGLGVIMAVLTTSSDVFRSVLGFAPGFLDLLFIVWFVRWVSNRRSFPTGGNQSSVQIDGNELSPTPN